MMGNPINSGLADNSSLPTTTTTTTTTQSITTPEAEKSGGISEQDRSEYNTRKVKENLNNEKIFNNH